MKKAVLYINQFFGQIGGEDKADFEPVIGTESNGVSKALDDALQGAKVTHTIICGDNYMGSRQEEALTFLLGELEKIDFDILIAGPAFQAGRYGSACGVICKAVQEKFGKPVITSMHEENPGVDLFRHEFIILRGGKSAASMRNDVKKMADYVNRLFAGDRFGWAEQEGYFGRELRHQVWPEDQKPASKRVVEMLLKKLHGEPFVTELPIPKSDRVPIAAPVKDLSHAKIAIVTSGGVVPVDNPDRIQSASATRWGRYDIENMDRLKSGEFKTIHAGYDPAVCDANPNVCVPVDAMRDLEKKGKIGKLDRYFYSTVGTGTTQAEATRMGNEIASKLKEEQVDAVLLVSTSGTCTRCGAAMTKAIEREGFPVAQIANLTPIAKTVGANRIVQSYSIPYPMGDPNKSPEDEFNMRERIVEKALEVLTEDISDQTVCKVNMD